MMFSMQYKTVFVNVLFAVILPPSALEQLSKLLLFYILHVLSF